jgi:outer membrane biosynthesis protein TonB
MAQLLLLSLCWPAWAHETYKPAAVLSAGDAYFPYQFVADGLFVLDVSLDEHGKVSRIQALRNPGTLLDATEKSVHNWKFHPASVDGRPGPSRLTVTFVYSRTGFSSTPSANFSAVIPPPDSGKRGGYIPLGILSFAYPEYPLQSVASGSVVVQLTVDASGDVTGVDFLYGPEIFTKVVTQVLPKWKFQAADFKDKPIASKTVIAFIFQPPMPGR